MITHTNLLKPLPKSSLENPVEFEIDDAVLETNIDGIPYVLSNPEYASENLQKGIKFKPYSSTETYTVKHIDYDKNRLEAKLDKTLVLDGLEINQLREKLNSWGDKKEAEKLQPNYQWQFKNFVIDGKLSKNQVIRFHSSLVKITELVRKSDGLIEIIGEKVPYISIADIYPYRVNNEVKEWYFDIKDVWLRQAKDYKKEGNQYG